MTAFQLRPESGIKQEVTDKVYHPLVDPGRGKHLWTIIVMYAVADPRVVADPSGQFLLDRENLLTIEGPGCYKCEQPWKAGLERRWCQGSMT